MTNKEKYDKTVSMIEVVVKDKVLIDLETDEAGSTKYSAALINSYRKKINYLRSVNDERDLRNMKSLHYEKLKGDREGQHSIRLNDQYRLVFVLDKDESPNKLTVIGIEDYHH